MGFIVKFAFVVAAIVGIGFWIAEGVERQNVRDCLADLSQRYGTVRGHDVYLTDVVEVNVYRTYPDGTATRFVKYQIQGSQDLQSTTCLW
ncbi:hypothetical protein MACH17_05080 [Phaeobacter inhibens]|nr:hypothetical protein MACH17_05080 [Phaeobacter inhibens]